MRTHSRTSVAAATDPRCEQVAALGRPAVWVALLTTLLGYGGVFTTYVYLAPQLTDVAGFDRMWITPLLLLFGAGLFVGNHLGGKLADRALLPSIVGTLAAPAISLFAAIDGALGLASVNWIGGLLTTSGLSVAVLGWLLLDRRRRHTDAATAGDHEHRVQQGIGADHHH